MYRLIQRGKTVLYIKTADSLKMIPKLADRGFKADMIFLDPPYRTRATHGWNRPMRFDTITYAEFGIITDALAEIVRTDSTPVYYIYSNAKTGLRKMDKYTAELFLAGFKIVDFGLYQKTFKNGKAVTNPSGRTSPPEGIMLLTKSGEFTEREDSRNLNFKFVRPSVIEYPTQKPLELCRSLVRQGTFKGNLIIDPFIGSGRMAEASIIEGRRFIGYDISEDAINNVAIPKIKESVN